MLLFTEIDELLSSNNLNPIIKMCSVILDEIKGDLTQVKHSTNAVGQTFPQLPIQKV